MLPSIFIFLVATFHSLETFIVIILCVGVWSDHRFYFLLLHFRLLLLFFVFLVFLFLLFFGFINHFLIGF
jgi:hypothetical protein